MNVDTGETRELQTETLKKMFGDKGKMKQAESQAAIMAGMRRVADPKAARAHKQSEPVKPDRPTKREITWQLGDPITNLDECAIARAVLKRTKRSMKAAKNRGDRITEVECKIRCDALLHALRAYHERPRKK
jgi:hypothetical protein